MHVKGKWLYSNSRWTPNKTCLLRKLVFLVIPCSSCTRAHMYACTHTHKSHSIHLYQITATFPNFTSFSVSASTLSAFILLTLAPPFLSQPLQSLHNTMSSDLSTALDTQQFFQHLHYHFWQDALPRCNDTLGFFILQPTATHHTMLWWSLSGLFTTLTSAVLRSSP